MFYEAARSANTPADRSKRATQLSPGAALPALCLLVPGRFGFAVHQTGDSVYDTVQKSCPVHQTGDSVYGTVQKSCPVHETGDSVYGTVQKSCPVHETGDSVYGILRKSCPVHQIGDSVYGYKDYDENGQEKGAYSGRWRRN